MIKRIVIKSIASYDRIGVVFDDLQKVNLIYGSNGVGKTTFSRVLADQARWTTTPRCLIEWEGAPAQILVYNRDYKDYYLGCYPDQATLSEGEATVAAFQHFVKSVDKMPGPKVVVIDDPISSLDYDGINSISTLTNSLIRKARKQRLADADRWIEQVFVLTHNAIYHKSLSVNQPRRNTSYWKLFKRNGNSRLKPFGVENPVHGDYEELWQMVRSKDAAYRCGFGLPNVMRRIAEIYFLEYGACDRDTILSRLQCFEKEADNISNRGQIRLFHQFFTELGHEEHFNMMMRL